MLVMTNKIQWHDECNILSMTNTQANQGLTRKEINEKAAKLAQYMLDNQVWPTAQRLVLEQIAKGGN